MYWRSLPSNITPAGCVDVAMTEAAAHKLQTRTTAPRLPGPTICQGGPFTRDMPHERHIRHVIIAPEKRRRKLIDDVATR